jgi:hypothetical protein
VIVSHELFMWVVTALAVGVCVGWGVREVYLLCKNLPRRGRAAWPDRGAWRDQIFGSIIGLLMVGLGLYGVLRYHLNW